MTKKLFLSLLLAQPFMNVNAMYRAARQATRFEQEIDGITLHVTPVPHNKLGLLSCTVINNNKEAIRLETAQASIPLLNKEQAYDSAKENGFSLNGAINSFATGALITAALTATAIGLAEGHARNDAYTIEMTLLVPMAFAAAITSIYVGVKAAKGAMGISDADEKNATLTQKLFSVTAGNMVIQPGHTQRFVLATRTLPQTFSLVFSRASGGETTFNVDLGANASNMEENRPL